MAKFIKMALYGEPGVGKSTFASRAPKPFFITTDGNYEYLEDYCGAKPEDHVQVNSWREMKAVFARDFSNYETIVVDLVEDSYLWAETEFCKENAIKHISDLGYGKGYGLCGNDFFIEYQKLLSLPKNIILILHGVTEVLKDRRGVEYTKYGPSKLIREKLITQIEGRVRFFVRAFAETTEDESGQLVTQRYLSLSPDGMTEYGITRGLSGDIPRYIPLDWDTFYEIATKNDPITSSVTTTRFTEKYEAPKDAPEEKPATRAPKKVKSGEDSIAEIRAKLKAVTEEAQSTEPEAKPEPEVKPEPKLEPKPEPAPAPAAAEPVQTADDKLAAIRAKMAQLKGLK